MAVTITQTTFGTSDQATFHSDLATALGNAGYPTPFQSYTGGSPFLLVYEFTNGTGTYQTCYHVFGITSVSASTLNVSFGVFQTWNTTTRTGTGGSLSTYNITSNFAEPRTATAFSDSNGKFGFVNINTSSNSNLGLGFVKTNSNINGFTENSSSSTLFAMQGNNSAPTYTSNKWFTFGIDLKYGTGGQPVDPLCMKPTTYSISNFRGTATHSAPFASVSSSLGGYPIISPVILYSGGAPIGLAAPEITQGPYLNDSAPGDKIIVTQGVEEYTHLGSSLWLRTA